MKCIVATTVNGVIGNNQDIPWKLPVDQKRFKELTCTGSNPVIVMGRKTFDTFKKPLPNRNHVVLTRNRLVKLRDRVKKFSDKEYIRQVSLEELLSWPNLNDMWLIGGAEIYRLLAEQVNEIYLTLLLEPIQGNIYFPWDCYTDFELSEKGSIQEAKNGIKYTFLKYTRRKKND